MEFGVTFLPRIKGIGEIDGYLTLILWGFLGGLRKMMGVSWVGWV